MRKKKTEPKITTSPKKVVKRKKTASLPMPTSLILVFD